MLAEYLGLPCVSNVIAIEVMDDQHIKVSRLGDAGTEIVELELPAVVTVSDSINEPRLPADARHHDGKEKAHRGDGPGGTGDIAMRRSEAPRPKSEIVEFMESETRKAGQKFEGDAAEITAQVVDLLANEAKVL